MRIQSSICAAVAQSCQGVERGTSFGRNFTSGNDESRSWKIKTTFNMADIREEDFNRMQVIMAVFTLFIHSIAIFVRDRVSISFLGSNYRAKDCKLRHGSEISKTKQR